MKLFYVGGYQFVEQIQLQVKSGGGDFGVYFQCVVGDVWQMMVFIEDQQQVFWFWQYCFVFYCCYYQCMVGYYYFCFLNFLLCYKEWVFVIVVVVVVQVVGFIGVQLVLQFIVDGFVGMVVQVVLVVVVEILFQGCVQFLFCLIIWGEIVIEKGQQILL